MNISKLSQEQARYRLGNLWSHKIQACDDKGTFVITIDNVNNLLEFQKKNTKGRKCYMLEQDLKQILQIDPTLKIPCVTRDNMSSKHEKFRFCKQRSCGDLNTGMFDSRWLFQKNMQAEYETVPFKEKSPMLFWRGDSTGGLNYWQRVWLTNQGYNQNQRDVIQKSRIKIAEHFARHKHKNIDIKTFLNTKKIQQVKYMADVYSKYKYMLLLEGNDLGSNIWWTFKSNCVTLVPEVRKAECVYDLYIRPWKHYVPFDPFNLDDLVDKVNWCEKHPGKCIDIINRANHVHKLVINPELRHETLKLMAKKIKSNLII